MSQSVNLKINGSKTTSEATALEGIMEQCDIVDIVEGYHGNGGDNDKIVQLPGEEDMSENPEDNLERVEKAVLSVMKKMAKDVIKRAGNYRNKSYVQEVELASRGTVNGPVLGLFSVMVNFSVTAQVLLVSGEHRDAYKRQQATTTDNIWEEVKTIVRC